MHTAEPTTFVEKTWDESILPSIIEFMRIPNKSPGFDAKWRENGHMHRAVKLVADWMKRQPIEGLRVEVVEHANRTPVILAEIPARGGNERDVVLMYGHLDKQPEMTGWTDGLGPWTPVIKGDRLYGRGGADDGYAAYASLCAVMALQATRRPHARIVILIEATEESGSYDLPYYVEALADRIGRPSLIVCLDSGCGNYEQLWCTTSLRGLVAGNLRVDVLKEGVHSGDAGGIVASSFRVCRQLIDRIEDSQTGRVRMEALWSPVPAQRIEEAKRVAELLGTSVLDRFPWAQKTRPMTTDPTEAILSRTWRPSLAVTGAAGLPPVDNAGNVLRPYTTVRLAIRIPPGVDGERAYAAVKQTLESDPPQGASVSFEGDGASGWDAPKLAPWLAKAIEDASTKCFNKSAMFMGEGGTIPFMAMLGKRFPEAQFVITGVLGPESNAHGPNEFLHIPMAKRLTSAVAELTVQHATRAA